MRLFLWGLLLAQVGCEAHVEGMVRHQEGQPWLQLAEGGLLRLEIPESVSEVNFLDGLIVALDGTRRLRRVRVRDWSVQEGVHGVAAYVGRLERAPTGLVLHDRGTGGRYLLDEESSDLLEPLVGRPVLLEAYIDGPMVIHVAYYRSLFQNEGGP